jgi:adenosylhomocysteine nucleosidase
MEFGESFPMKKIFMFFLGFLFLITGCSSTTQCLQKEPIAPKGRVAVLTAFEPELEAFLSGIELEGEFEIHNNLFYLATIANQPVVICQTGVSMVNAALTAQTVIDYFDIDAIVFSGIAGGINPDLDIGDVVIPRQWGEYQEHLFAREAESGWDTGWFGSPFENFEMMFPQTVEVSKLNGRPGQFEERFWFPVDDEMYAIAEDVAENISLNQCTRPENCLSDMPEIIIGGNAVSGPTFVDNADYRQWVWETFKANAVDMESAAVAHVAYVNEVPFIAFRSLSDLAGGGPGENEISTFLSLATENAATVVKNFLEVWAKR